MTIPQIAHRSEGQVNREIAAVVQPHRVCPAFVKQVSCIGALRALGRPASDAQLPKAIGADAALLVAVTAFADVAALQRRR